MCPDEEEGKEPFEILTRGPAVKFQNLQHFCIFAVVRQTSWMVLRSLLSGKLLPQHFLNNVRSHDIFQGA